jgi:hypothetical protein
MNVSIGTGNGSTVSIANSGTITGFTQNTYTYPNSPLFQS